MTTETGSESREDVVEKIPVRNWWHMLLYAWDLVEFEGRFDAEVEDAPDLRALLTKILVFLTKRQIRRGLRGGLCRGVRGVARGARSDRFWSDFARDVDVSGAVALRV